MAQATGEIRYQVRGSAVWLSIDRTEQRNALNDAAIEGLLDGLLRAAEEAGARAVVITGTGERAFCSGADLTSTMAPSEGRVQQHDRRGRIGELILAIRRHPLPVVARVNGAALAGGFGLMLACDLVVAADDVEVGTPEINLGLWPYMISAVILRNVPRKIALEMMLTGRRMPVSEAARWGMVNRVVPRDRLDRAVDELVSELASKSSLILRLGKESFARAEDMGLEEGLGYLQAMLTLNLETEDVVEGVSAFLQKRSPNWRGR
jgi:enoyl-CoA hydratase/carnithine racemase